MTQVGAEALPFLGAYGVLPVNIAFFAFYSWLVRGGGGRGVQGAGLKLQLAGGGGGRAHPSPHPLAPRTPAPTLNP